VISVPPDPTRLWIADTTQRWTDEGLVHHSDHGCQYTSLAFGRRLRDTGIVGSTGSVADCYDNAAAESFVATLKTELLSRRS